MKNLYLMRHAKSSWKDDHLMDHERPLKKRGRKDAVAMGALLGGKKRSPDIIYASTAERVRETAGLVAEKSGYMGEIRYLKQLYLAEPDALIDLLQGISDDVDSVLLVGHNPGMEALTQMFSGKIIALTTSSIAHLNMPIEKWSEIKLTTHGELAHLWQPKEK